MNLKIYLVGLTILIFLSLTPIIVLARVTPNDIYQQTRADFEANLNKVSDPNQKQQIIQADQDLNQINQTVCQRFDIDIAKMAAILEEEKSRQNITSNVVAFGMGNTPMDSAEYYLNYAQEAVAYQKIQDYTPQIGSGNYKQALTNSMNNLQSSLETVQGKILRAKTEVKKALDYYEK